MLFATEKIERDIFLKFKIYSFQHKSISFKKKILKEKISFRCEIPRIDIFIDVKNQNITFIYKCSICGCAAGLLQACDQKQACYRLVAGF